MKAALAVAALASVLAAPAAAQADGAAGKARSCTPCHGPVGISSAPDAPHLAGQPEMYLAAQLRAYRSGTRPHPVMNVIAKPLSDDDIAAVAGWFSRIKIEAREP